METRAWEYAADHFLSPPLCTQGLALLALPLGPVPAALKDSPPSPHGLTFSPPGEAPLTWAPIGLPPGSRLGRLDPLSTPLQDLGPQGKEKQPGHVPAFHHNAAGKGNPVARGLLGLGRRWLDWLLKKRLEEMAETLLPILALALRVTRNEEKQHSDLIAKSGEHTGKRWVGGRSGQLPPDQAFPFCT